MKKAEKQIDFQEDKVTILTKKVGLNFISTGHYCKICFQINPNIFSVCSSIKVLSYADKFWIALKIYGQPSHPHSDRLLSLVNDCNIDNKEIKKCIVDIDQKCQTCQL